MLTTTTECPCGHGADRHVVREGAVVQPCLDCGCMFLGSGIGGVDVVTCEKSLRNPPGATDRWCRHIWAGHQCKWSDKPHARWNHVCRCGEQSNGGDTSREWYRG